LGLATFNRQNPPAPIATAAKQAAASNQDILSQDKKKVVIKTKPKNTTFKRNGEGKS
jgi:hypothetical protein